MTMRHSRARASARARLFRLGLRFIRQSKTHERSHMAARWSKSIEFNSHSVRFKRNATYHPQKPLISKRGSIKSFSRHSRLRLRESLSNSSLPDSQIFGITLTLPWKDSSDTLLEDYRASFNRFTSSFRFNLPFSACIFRHELQRRRMPHCHLVCWLSSSDALRLDIQNSDDLKSFVFNWWRKALQDMRGGSFRSFLNHGVDVSSLDDKLAMFRYISDHASKSKQAQLGYMGKQWGFINRKLLHLLPSDTVRFVHRSDFVFFQRSVSRLTRFRLAAPCVFGSKLSHNRSGISINFVSSNTVNKLLDFIGRNRIFQILAKTV